MSDEWVERQRLAGGQWRDTSSGNLLSMADPTEVPWCAEHGLMDWRPYGYEIVLSDGSVPIEGEADR